MLTISVIIPVYQGAKTIQETIESVLAQTFPVAEIIVIDDGSTDDLDKVLEQFNDRIILLKQENSGPAAARNNGIRHSSGDIIAFLDADDIWFPKKLALQMPLFENPQVMVVYGNVCFLNEGKLQNKTYFDLYSPKRGQIFQSLFALDYIPILSVLVRRQIFDQFGVFNESIRYAEDYDLLLRLARVAMFDYIQDPVAIYRISPQQSSKNFIKVAESLLQLKENVYKSNIHLFVSPNENILERGLYNKYLKLALCYMREGKNLEACQVLGRFREFHQRSLVYILFRIILFLPAPVLSVIIRIWDKLYQKPELGFY